MTSAPRLTLNSLMVQPAPHSPVVTEVVIAQKSVSRSWKVTRCISPSPGRLMIPELNPVGLS